MTAWLISALPCGCYMRQGDGRWFWMPECPHHGHKCVPEVVTIPTTSDRRMPAGTYR